MRILLLFWKTAQSEYELNEVYYSMFDYTKAALNKLKDDFKKLALICNIGVQISTILYLLYSVCIGSGVFIANLLLLILAVGYFIFFLYVTKTEGKKQLKKLVKQIYKWCKLLIKPITIGVAVYDLFTASEYSPISTLLVAIMIIGWAIQILFEFIYKLISIRVEFFIEALKADVENITKPFQTVGNFFKKVTGKETEEEVKEPSKHRLWLDKTVASMRSAREEKKSADKLAAKEQKRAAKQAKKQEKLDRRAAKKRSATDETDSVADTIAVSNDSDRTNFDE